MVGRKENVEVRFTKMRVLGISMVEIISLELLVSLIFSLPRPLWCRSNVLSQGLYCRRNKFHLPLINITSLASKHPPPLKTIAST